MVLTFLLIGLGWWLAPVAPRAPLDDARAKLASGLAGQAERALREASATDPGNPEVWRLRLELLRVEDRSLEADRLAWQAYAQVPTEERTAILRELTLALLADLPEDVVRSALARWSAADPSDIEARVALLRRIAGAPRSSDPDRPARLTELAKLVAEQPEHLNAREALISELADAGEPDRGREVLDAWPGVEADRDARYWRLRGRWDLEYDEQPARAVEEFRRVLAEQPHDWRTRYRLARALRQLGKIDESDAEAEAVRRTREVLDPLTLGPKLDASLRRLADPSARLELSELCRRAGLARLAEAWRAP